MPGHDIIVVGASAGGVEALVRLASGLPAGLAAAVFVVLHIPPDAHSVLPEILNRAGRLPAGHPMDGEPIEPGHIYVAPPDYHLRIGEGHVRLSHGPRQNGHRPAVDPLFVSAARSYGPRVIGVILSGSLDDGAIGLSVIKHAGGLAVVQDPKEALYPGMPRSAMDLVEPDHVVPSTDVGSLLARLAAEPVVVPVPPDRDRMAAMTDERDEDAAVIDATHEAFVRDRLPDGPTILTCPDCGGVLAEIDENDVVHFRCQVGHKFSLETLLALQSETVEQALWTAVRLLNERSALLRRMANEARGRGHERSSARMDGQAKEAEHARAVLRHVLEGNGGGPGAEDRET